MATKPKKTASVINLALLAAIGNGTFANTFVHVQPAEAKPMVDALLIEQNPTVVDAAGALATRTTPAGVAYLTEHAGEVKAAAAASTAAAASGSNGAAAADTQVSAFVMVDDFELPAQRRTGPSRGETYPFAKLNVGQAFFIPATADKPNPERSYASTVTSAKNRYAKEIEGQTRLNRKGRTVPQVTYERDFAIRRLDDGKAFGQPGVAGAVVKRIA